MNLAGMMELYVHPMGAMNSFDINSIIRECEKLGLRRFREENGEKIIGDYYIGTQFGLDDTFQYRKSDWIRVHNGVCLLYTSDAADE